MGADAAAGDAARTARIGSHNRRTLEPANGMAILTVIMPVYNEITTITEAIRRVLASPLVGQVIVADDGSTDGSSKAIAVLAAEDPRIMAVAHTTNEGKGRALRSAFPLVACELAVVQDADLEYDPNDYPGLVAPIVERRARVVYGRRDLMRSTFLSRLANRALTGLTNLLYGSRLSDMETGLKVMSAQLWRALDLECDSFDIEPEITGRCLIGGLAILEVDVSYRPRSVAEGKKISWIDAIAAVRVLIAVRVSGQRRRLDSIDVRPMTSDLDVLDDARAQR